MENKKDEQMIYLKDLLFAALYRWRSVLATALLLALVFGGVKAFSSLSASKNDPTTDIPAYQAALQQYEEEKESLAKQVEILEKSIQNQQNYLDNSILMQLDPYAFYEACMTVYVDTGYQIQPGMDFQTPDKTAPVLRGYLSALYGSQVMQTLAEAFDTQPQYVPELISVSINNEARTLVITAKHADAEGAKKLLTLFNQQLASLKTQLAQSIAAHDLSIIEQSVHPKTDADLAATQQAETDRTVSLLDSQKSTQETLNNLAAPVLQTTSVSAVVKDAIVYVVVGGILGAFLAVFVAFVAHIASGKVYSARTLKNRTGVKVLGCIGSTAPKSPVDRWLRKLEGRNVSDSREQAALLAVNIRNRCGQTKHLLVISDTDTESKDQLVQALRDALPGVRVDAHGSLLQDAAALESLASCDTVLLLEQCHYSRYAIVEQEAEIICDQSKCLIGCVLLGG